MSNVHTHTILTVFPQRSTPGPLYQNATQTVISSTTTTATYTTTDVQTNIVIPTPTCPTANIITNSGFNTGDLSNWTITAQDGAQTYSVIRTSGNTNAYEVQSGGDDEMDNTITQVVNTTPGAMYTISMQYMFGGSDEQQIQLAAGGQNVMVLSFGSTTWQTASFNVTAPTSSMVVEVTTYLESDGIAYIADVRATGPDCGGG